MNGLVSQGIRYSTATVRPRVCARPIIDGSARNSPVIVDWICCRSTAAKRWLPNSQFFLSSQYWAPGEQHDREPVRPSFCCV